MLVKPISAPPATTAPVYRGFPVSPVTLLSYGEVQVALKASDMPTNARRDTPRAQVTAWAEQGIARLGGVTQVRALDAESDRICRRRAAAWNWVELVDENPSLVIVDYSGPVPREIDALGELLDADAAFKRIWRNDARNQRCVSLAFRLVHRF